MNPAETHEITELISRLRDERGVAICVIEHDMHVVRVAPTGSSRSTTASRSPRAASTRWPAIPAVVEAYMGRDPEALAEA